jgi:hypothetical protein
MNGNNFDFGAVREEFRSAVVDLRFTLDTLLVEPYTVFAAEELRGVRVAQWVLYMW